MAGKDDFNSGLWIRERGGFSNIYRRLGVPFKLVKTADDLSSVSKIILPGVGSFDWAMTKLKRSGLVNRLNHLVLEKKIPVLGVCVGMHIMANNSDEGKLSGLGWIDANVKRFDVKMFKQKMPLPHMGWNDVATSANCKLFADIDRPKYYFLHSYFIEPSNKACIVGLSNYGIEFASAVARDNIYATQFHPEKSHAWGVKLLKNFASFC